MDIVFKEESYGILGACFEVYREKENGFLEDVYQEYLGFEFMKRGISCNEKPWLKLFCKEHPLAPFRTFRVFRS